MTKIRYSFSIVLAVLLVALLSTFTLAYAHPHLGTLDVNNHTHDPQTELLPLNDFIAIQKTTLFFHSPDETPYYWGYVEGRIANFVPGFPVVIKMFNEDESFPRFGQAEVDDDGYYEYRFRVKNMENGKLVWKIEGDYTIIVYKVVYLDSSGFNLI